MIVRLSTLGPQGPFSIKICERLLLSYTAWCLPTCLVRRWSYKGAQQLPSCHGYARAGGVRTAQTLNWGPRQSPAKRVWWGEEEQGSGMMDAHTWASGIERTLRRRRPQWAEARRTQGLVFGAAGRKCLSSRRASPRKWGPGQAAYERPLREGAHRRRPRRFFGDFLIVQKVTPSSRPAGRNSPPKHKKILNPS